MRALLGDRPRRRDLLIEHLHLIQDRYGHLSAAHLAALAAEMKLALTEVYEVATFYAHFDVVKEGETPPPPVTVRVCDSLSCAMAGAERLLARSAGEARARRARRARALHGRVRPRAGLRGRPCAGDAGGRSERRRRPSRKSAHAHAHKPQVDFDAYRAAGGYTLLGECLAGTRTRDDIIKARRRRGPARARRRGLSRPAASGRWCAQEPAPRLMAVNGDEGEPGTFKDRYYLGLDPHRFIEGMLIAAWVVEAADIYVYLRDEYPELIADAARGVRARRAGGPCRRTRTIHLRRGAGAYICGEESAMIESIEGKRGLPRHRPPYVAQVGLFGRPTLEQNVETLYWVRDIVEKGAAWFTSHGRRERKGFRSFSVSGRVKKPGVVLAPAGVTARELIEEFCGGMTDGHTLQGLPAGRRVGRHPAGLDGGRAARFRHAGKIRLLRRFARGCHPVRPGRHEGRGAQPDALLRGRELRPVHALPRRHREGRQADGNRAVG